MIKLKSLLTEVKRLPDPSLAQYLLSEKVESFSNWVYHGTPLEGLKSMLTEGIFGNQHGEIAEYEAFSTSINSEVLNLFSEMEGETGLQFKVHDMKILVLDDILQHLAIQTAGSGMDVEVDEQELEQFCQKFNIPVDGRGRPYFPYGYLASLGIDGVVYDYVWKRMARGYTGGDRDESEICFVGKGIDKLNHLITEIYVDGTPYEPEQRAEALQDIEARL